MFRKMLSSLLEGYQKWTYFPLAKRMILRRIVEVAGMLRGRLLDVGAGDRPYEKLFVNATEYIGSNSQTYYTADEIRELEPYTDLWIDDAVKLPCDDSSFDSILLLQVLSDISDPPAFFAEARRVLKPGGRLLITTDFLYPAWGRYRYTARGLAGLCTEAGFTVVTHQAMGGFGATLYCLIARYINYYSERLRQVHGLRRWTGYVGLVVCLGLLPVFSLAGMLIYLCERNSRDQFWCTFNQLIVCESPRQAGASSTDA